MLDTPFRGSDGTLEKMITQPIADLKLIKIHNFRPKWMKWKTVVSIIRFLLQQGKNMNYFTSGDPHHDIYTFC